MISNNDFDEVLSVMIFTNREFVGFWGVQMISPSVSKRTEEGVVFFRCCFIESKKCVAKKVTSVMVKWQEGSYDTQGIQQTGSRNIDS